MLSTVIDRIKHILSWILFRFIDGLLRFSARRYLTLSAACQVACRFDVWMKIEGEVPLDMDSPRYKAIVSLVEHYLYQDNTTRIGLSHYERRILPLNYFAWLERDDQRNSAFDHWKIVKQYHLVSTLRKYQNLQRLINLWAVRDIHVLEKHTEYDSVQFWADSIREKHLPIELSSKPRNIQSYLRRRISEAKKAIGEQGRYKFALSLSAVSSFVAIAGAMMIASSYIRTNIVFGYFGIPFGDYFSAADYLSSSITVVDDYLILTAITMCYAAISYSAGTASVVTVGGESVSVSKEERFFSLVQHLIAVSSTIALGYQYWNEKRLDPTLLFIMILYGGLRASQLRVVSRYAAHKTQLLFVLMFLSLAVGHLVSGTAREIYAIEDGVGSTNNRLFEFESVTYDEPAWRVLAVTSDFLIFRRQVGGRVDVMAKYRLISVSDRGTASLPPG